jgi:hypothetical protein
MVTFFTIPKPFEGHVGMIQRNALRSWLRLAPDVQVIAIGEMDRAVDVDHVPNVARNGHGTPLLNDAFRIAEERARHQALCFCNADILLPQSFSDAVAVAAARQPFLLVGECWNVRVASETDCIPEGGKRRGADALDFFCYSRGVFSELPPFAAGRAAFDNWLVWYARSSNTTVIDATLSVRAVHQDHSYSHIGTIDDMRNGPEAIENRRLAGGGRERLYSRLDATHLLVRGRLVPNPLAVAHGGETIRRAVAKLAYTARLRA